MYGMNVDDKPLTKKEKLVVNTVLSAVAIYVLNFALNWGINSFYETKNSNLLQKNELFSSYVDSCEQKIKLYESEQSAIKRLNKDVKKDTSINEVLRVYFNQKYDSYNIEDVSDKITSEIQDANLKIENKKLLLRSINLNYDYACSKAESAKKRMYNPLAWFVK